MNFDAADPWQREKFNSWVFNVLLLFESAYYMNNEGYVHQGSFLRFEQLVLSIASTTGGRHWWKLAYDVIGLDVGQHIDVRLNELGNEVVPWDELLPHMKLDAET